MSQTNHPWEESRGMGFSYGYNRNEKLAQYHSSRDLILMLVDIRSLPVRMRPRRRGKASNAAASST